MSLQQVSQFVQTSPVLISSAAQEKNILNECSHFQNNNAFLHLSDLSDALEKMKGVYEKNPQMGDPSSLEPQITETAHNIGRLRGELTKYEVVTHTHTMHAYVVCIIRLHYMCFYATLTSIAGSL